MLHLLLLSIRTGHEDILKFPIPHQHIGISSFGSQTIETGAKEPFPLRPGGRDLFGKREDLRHAISGSLDQRASFFM